MDARDIFMLLKSGRTEEAYETIRPIYASRKDRLTITAMFWAGVAMMRERYRQRRLEEAYRIFLALERLYPALDDHDKRGQTAMMRAAILVYDHNTAFSMLRFLSRWDITRLRDDDWLMPQADGKQLPSLAMRLMARAFKDVRQQPTREVAMQAAPLLAEALRHSPYNMNNQRYKALIYRIMGKTDKALNIYRHLIARHRLSHLYQEMAEMTTDLRYRTALLATSIATQREQRYATSLRLQLANILFVDDKPRARYELDACIAQRQAAGYALTWEILNLDASLQGVKPVTKQSQREFYKQQENIVKELEIK